MEIGKCGIYWEQQFQVAYKFSCMSYNWKQIEKVIVECIDSQKLTAGDCRTGSLKTWTSVRKRLSHKCSHQLLLSSSPKITSCLLPYVTAELLSQPDVSE